MRICVIGTGYVGLVTGTCLAEMGNNVVCVDKDAEKLAKIEEGIIPIYEPGLEELIIRNSSRLSFSSDLENSVKKSDICFIAVGTPQLEDGSANLEQVYDVALAVAKSMNEYKIIVNKSTVPVGTGQKIIEIIEKNSEYEFDFVSNPEFLKQGAAVEDFMKPDRVILGSKSKKALDKMSELYAPFLRTGNPIIKMDVNSAEMVKYASNSFLAVKISFINEIANICEKIGADIDQVRKGMSADKRIGSKFLFPGLGYGGSCFPKDIRAMIETAVKVGCDSNLLIATDKTNINQRKLFIEKIIQKFGKNLTGKTFAVWGLAFKPNTNDMREAPSITIINELLNMGGRIIAFDPKAMDSAYEIFQNRIEYAKSAYEALVGANALVLLTEWNEFRNPDFAKIKELLVTPIIFDGRNQYDNYLLNEIGFEYLCVGKGVSNEVC